jgi:hypothetical protein
VAKVLKDHGIPPARGPRPGARFLREHWGGIAGADFFTTEVWTAQGMVTYYTLFVLDLESRRVQVVGSTPNPNSRFIVQAARRRTDAVDGFLADHRVGGKLGGAGRSDAVPGAERQRLRGAIRANDTRGVPGSPDSVRGTAPDPGARRVYGALPWGTEPSGALGNDLIAPGRQPLAGTRVRCRERLGGLLRYYHYAA